MKKGLIPRGAESVWNEAQIPIPSSFYERVYPQWRTFVHLDAKGKLLSAYAKHQSALEDGNAFCLMQGAWTPLYSHLAKTTVAPLGMGKRSGSLNAADVSKGVANGVLKMSSTEPLHITSSIARIGLILLLPTNEDDKSVSFRALTLTRFTTRDVSEVWRVEDVEWSWSYHAMAGEPLRPVAILKSESYATSAAAQVAYDQLAKQFIEYQFDGVSLDNPVIDVLSTILNDAFEATSSKMRMARNDNEERKRRAVEQALNRARELEEQERAEQERLRGMQAVHLDDKSFAARMRAKRKGSS